MYVSKSFLRKANTPRKGRMTLSMRAFGVNLDPKVLLNRVFFVVFGVLQL